MLSELLTVYHAISHRWSAWRRGKPGLLGYGSTEDFAKADLVRLEQIRGHAQK